MCFPNYHRAIFRQRRTHMAKTGTKTRRGPSAKQLTGSKGSSTTSKRSGGGGRPGEQGHTSAEKRAGVKGG
jgi:hypothetical protein